MHMPLHPHLKRHLEYNDLYTDPDDDIEETPVGFVDPQERAAKRRRVEAIAARYLCGHSPAILSASLRGPFNNGWKNPWAKGVQASRTASKKQTSTSDQRRASAAQNTTRASSPLKTKVLEAPPRMRARNTKRTASPSPEASRAARDDMDDGVQDDSLDEVEVPPATAPSPEASHASGESFKNCIHDRSLLIDLVWLRRPSPQRNLDLRRATQEIAETSPTHTRSQIKDPAFNSRRSLRLASAKASLHKHPSLPKAVTPEEWRSSASASMVISSPVRTQDEGPTLYSRLPEPVCGQPTPPNRKLSQAGLAKKRSKAETPRQRTRRGAQSASTSDPFVAMSDGSSANGTHRRISREDIQRSAERLINIMATSSGSLRQLERSNDNKARGKTSKKAPKHDLIASPMLSSSSGFVYRKLGEGKRTSNRTRKSVSKAIDVDFSPLPKDRALSTERPNVQATALNEETAICRSKSPRRDVLPAVKINLPLANDKGTELDDHGTQNEGGRPRCSPDTQQSTFSTQAAMLLAHMEFHESPCSTASPATQKPWLLLANGTPPQVSPMPSPAITPLSVFNDQLQKSFMTDSTSRCPPISTQDLFSAASPFAFSTIKKRPEDTQCSKLRFALLQNNAGLQPKTTLLQSSTLSTGRVPLKVKNVATPLWSFADGEASQASQESLADRTKRSARDIEAPMMPNESILGSEIDFTNKFLCNPDSP